MVRIKKSGRTNQAKWVKKRGRWQINVMRDGAYKTFTCATPGNKGKIEAERKADQWLLEKTRDVNMRYEELWRLFLEEMKANTGTANYKKHDQMGRLWILPPG